MYSVSEYGRMLADRVRTDAYARALRAAIRPGSVVVDIGTGTGFFAMLACQLGAERVYAIEPNDAIGLAREMAQANGYADRIAFYQDFSTDVDLPERADVIVSDLRGILPLVPYNIPSAVDARRRLLKPGGVFIPAEDRLWVAVAEAPEEFERLSTPWLSGPYGIEMSAGWRVASNAWGKGRQIKSEQLRPTSRGSPGGAAPRTASPSGSRRR
jgi:type I protein arginine methyltransferase